MEGRSPSQIQPQLEYWERKSRNGRPPRRLKTPSWFQFATKRTQSGQGNSARNCFHATVRRWKWEFQCFDKRELWWLHSGSVKRSSPQASMRQLVTSELISKALWVGETACPGISGRKKKEKPQKNSHIALLLARSLPPLSLSPFEYWQKFRQWQ